jgi:hypothetical protein
MAVRNGWRVGRHLVVDDITGLPHYDDEMVKVWDGSIRHKKHFETRQPQEFVKGKNDPYPVKDARPDTTLDVPANFAGVLVPNTTVPVPTGPASHLFDPGIGTMIVGTSFYVR